MPVRSMTSCTAPWRAPPSEVKSFWYSIRTTAVRLGSRGTTTSFRWWASQRELREPLGEDESRGRLDEREVREGLREVPEVAARGGVELLGVQPERRGLAQQPLHEVARR